MLSKPWVKTLGKFGLLFAIDWLIWGFLNLTEVWLPVSNFIDSFGWADNTGNVVFWLFILATPILLTFAINKRYLHLHWLLFITVHLVFLVSVYAFLIYAFYRAFSNMSLDFP